MEIIASILLIIFVWKFKDISSFFNSLFTEKNIKEKTSSIQPKNTISDVKKTEILTLVNLLQQIQVMNSTGVAVTNFQDELKANTRTKEEVEKEKNDIKISQINKDASETFEKIKSEILRCAKNGDYTVLSGKKVITATVFMPVNYYTFREVPATFEKVRNSFFDSPQPSLSQSERDDRIDASLRLGLYGKKHYHLELKTHRKIIYEPESNSRYKLFWKELKRLTATENITILHIILDKKSNMEYTFPCSIEDIRWNECNSLIKCICAIPEQYSSDIPITALYDNTSKSKVSDSGANQSSISIDDLDGHSFEYFCAELLLKNGYENVDVTKGSGDQGIDIIAYKDGIKYGIQCKCYTADIGNKAIQEAFAGKTYYKCHIGVVLTNRYFTHSAKDLAENNGIILWDRSYLLDLVKKAGIKVNN